MPDPKATTITRVSERHPLVIKLTSPREVRALRDILANAEVRDTEQDAILRSALLRACDHALSDG